MASSEGIFLIYGSPANQINTRTVTIEKSVQLSSLFYFFQLYGHSYLFQHLSCACHLLITEMHNWSSQMIDSYISAFRGPAA